MFSLTLRLLSVILCTVIASYHSNSVGVTQYRHVTMAIIYTLLHELICNIVSYCMSGVVFSQIEGE